MFLLKDKKLIKNNARRVPAFEKNERKITKTTKNYEIKGEKTMEISVPIIC